MTTGQKNGMTIGLKRVVHLNAHDMHEINARLFVKYITCHVERDFGSGKGQVT